MLLTEAEKAAVLRTRLKNGRKTANAAVDLLLDLNEAGAIPAEFAERFATVAAQAAKALG